MWGPLGILPGFHRSRAARNVPPEYVLLLGGCEGGPRLPSSTSAAYIQPAVSNMAVLSSWFAKFLQGHSPRAARSGDSRRRLRCKQEGRAGRLTTQPLGRAVGEAPGLVRRTSQHELRRRRLHRGLQPRFARPADHLLICGDAAFPSQGVERPRGHRRGDGSVRSESSPRHD